MNDPSEKIYQSFVKVLKAYWFLWKQFHVRSQGLVQAVERRKSWKESLAVSSL